MCCNNSWDFSKLPVVEHFNYKEIMITGGEPLLFPEKLANLAESIKTVQKLAYGNKGKLFLYTALADMLPNYIRYFDGVVYTPHSVNDVHSLLEANNFLLDYKDELIPDNTDLSLWKVKDMQWIKDCPVPADEEFKRVAELWEVE
ncbi:MAG: 4Fe-4S single cluster domain protein [Bacteriophage sp.]|nr:MAG: 4Fe-4S single cluster domain protein [Bacteriophage sp.]